MEYSVTMYAQEHQIRRFCIVMYDIHNNNI